MSLDQNEILNNKPLVGKSIYSESAPIIDIQRIGIELEGVGTVDVQWGGRTPKKSLDEFRSVFKRTPLIKSDDYDGNNGLFIVPEETDKIINTRYFPAELVSSPHPLNEYGLDKLRTSFKKAMMRNNHSNTMLKRQKTTLRDMRQVDESAFNRKQYTAWTRWGLSPITKVGGSLQTTIGVPVDKLLSDDKNTRFKVVEMIVGDKNKQKKVMDLLSISICIEQVCRGGDGTLGLLTDVDSKYGIRLSAFMYLLLNFPSKTSMMKKLWHKDVYGANFKGFSSLIGTGAGDLNYLMARMANRRGCIDNIKNLAKQAGVSQLALDCLAKVQEYMFSDLGTAGLSIQTDVEKWYSIPNFIHKGRLHTVVELREKSSPINIEMASFINGNISSEIFLKKLRISGIIS